MYKMTACCAVGYKNHNEADIHQINLNCTFYSVSHITRNLFLTDSSTNAEKHTSIIFNQYIVRGLNFICGDFELDFLNGLEFTQVLINTCLRPLHPI